MIITFQISYIPFQLSDYFQSYTPFYLESIKSIKDLRSYPTQVLVSFALLGSNTRDN